MQQLEALVKMEPTKEEEAKLESYKGDINELGSAEKFVKAMLKVPFAFSRIEAMLYRETFEDEVVHLRKSFSMLEVQQYNYAKGCVSEHFFCMETAQNFIFSIFSDCIIFHGINYHGKTWKIKYVLFHLSVVFDCLIFFTISIPLNFMVQENDASRKWNSYPPHGK